MTNGNECRPCLAKEIHAPLFGSLLFLSLLWMSMEELIRRVNGLSVYALLSVSSIEKRLFQPFVSFLRK
jgi:hypothetical protein